MKKLILAVFVGTCVIAAQAKTRPYVSVYGGGSRLQDTDFKYSWSSGSASASDRLRYDLGGVYGAAIGTSIGSLPLRIEVEYSYRKNGIDDAVGGYKGRINGGRIESTALMVNLYYDFKSVDGLYDYLSGPVYPYVFVGAGSVDSEITIATAWWSGNKSESVFAGQVGIGFGWEITDHIIFDLKGRIMMTEDIEYENIAGSGTSLDLDKPLYAEVLAGLRFQF